MGFRAEVIIVMSGNGTIIRTSTMAGDMSKIGGAYTAVVADAIQSFTSDGFTVGTHSNVNTNGVTYHWVAYGAGDNLDVGQYTGNGTSQTINNVGFQAETAFVLGESGSQLVYRTNQNSNTFDLSNNGAYASSITSFGTDSFAVGSSVATNQNAINYHYFAFNDNANYFRTGTYTGNGSDNRNITGVGFESEFVIVKATSTNAFAIGKTESTGYNVDANVAGSSNQIQALQSDGFQVGFDANVNQNTTSYMYLAWRQNDVPLFVTTTADTSDGTTTSNLALRANQGGDGAISLREAILAANATRNVNGVVDEIDFAISGSGVRTITIGTTGLASITDAVAIDAWTQSGWSNSPLIELNGGNTGTLKDGFNLSSGSSGSTIRGFIINRFTGDGIEINSSNNNVIEGNWIGLNNTGTSASANALRGLYAINSTGLTIGGTSTASRNVISGNTQQGIYFDNVDNSFVYGNYVGTNVAGTGDVNGSSSNTAQSGLVMLNGSSGNQVGSAAAGARNVFSGNNHYGAEVQGSLSTNNNFVGNYIGTDASGAAALGNVNGGFSFWGSGTGNVLSGNVISGNGNIGVLVGSGAASSTIQANYIGLAADGSTVVGNVGTGIYVAGASTNTLIGTNADGSNDSAEANTISGNSDGVVVSDAGTTGTMIYGNFIGTDVTGQWVRGNTYDGVRIQAGATANYVGGSGTARRNIIAANGEDGVQVDGETSDGNFIQNNWIGLATDGVTVLGNGGDGIYISGGADNTVIGGIGLGNVILGARVVGIEIDGASTGTSILGNLIGINAAGTVIQGSGQNGILLENGAASTTIGGITAGQGNTIVDSGRLDGTWQSGIAVASSAGASNSIIGNSIYDNRGLGIDIGSTGVTANDNLDGDSGANNLQNTPMLTSATTNGSTVTVSGTLNSVASTAGILIHFYATPANGNVNTRQGRRYLGSTTVSTNASGNATFSNIALSSAVSAGELITATTTLSSSTSEFSQGLVATLNAGNSAPSTSQLIGTEQGGLTINTGGYSTWLEASDGGALLGGRTQLSMEFQFRATMPGDAFYAIASYTTPTDGDQLFLGAGKSGANEFLYLLINNQLVTINTDVDAIFDGNQRSLAFTWNQTAGAYAIYLDGAVLGSGTGLAAGFTFQSAGQFGLGVDLDSGADSWQPAALFQGTFKDVRIFSDVRTAAEIAASYRGELPYNEGNLVANWRFEDLSTEGRTSNTVSNNALNIRSLTNSWSTPDTPGLQLRIDENSVTGSVVGQVLATDVEREQRISSLLSADSSLRYSAETGQFYKVVSSTGTWSAAQTGAIATTLNTVAGQLATITSATENAFIRSMLTGTSWLGGSDSLNEGALRWYTGTSAGNVFWQGNATGYSVDGAYTNFASGEPNDFGGNEDFLEIDVNGRWNDSSASTTQGFYVVEWNADDVLDATNALTYTITSQTVSGAFAINSDSGVVTVANGTLLNFESQTSHTLTVRVTDGSGATFDKNFTIAINNLTEENNAPTDLSAGINLNTDGGNNAYLMTSNGGSVLGGRTAMTIEVSYAMSSNASSESPLISYAVAGSDNEVYLRFSPSGAITLTLNQNSSVSTGNIAALVDGKQHAIAVSWDNTAGDVRFYVDGQLVQTSTGVKTGVSLQAGGTLVMGQDQDSVNGGFNASQRFSGSIYDVRVWDRAISDEQISLNYQQAPGATETGLIANWRMSGLSGGNTVVDSVSGVNLTVANVAVGGSFTASTPTAGLVVTENASAGTRVGQVLVTDVDLSRDIVADGLFREGANPGTIATYTTGQTFGNWTVQSGDVELVGTTLQSSPLGGRSVDLNGSTTGAISQTLSTMAGRQYQVLFNVSGNWLSGETIKDFRVSAGGASQEYSVTQPTGWSTSNMLFSGRSMTFTADSSSTTLAFQSLDTGNSGAVIADVRVIEIPAAVQTLLSSDSTLSYDAGTGKFYKSVASNQTFTAAQAAAVASTLNGVTGQMVTISSRYENDLVWNMARNMTSSVWLGASDAGVEGTWRWNNGVSAGTTFWVGTGAGTLQAGSYANWVSGDPNDSGGNEDYLSLSLTTGQWNDVIGTNTRNYIIEWDASEVLSNYTYTITSNPSGAFAINSNTGEITVSNAAPLNEVATNPTITVQVTDAAGNTYSEVMTISVTSVNDNAPIITSNGGGATASINVAENTTAVTTITATDADLPAQTLTYSIVGGADSALFSISSSTGALSFITGRNFETPTDAGANNVYDVVVRVDDGTNWDDQSIAVTITNVNEAPTDLYAVPSVTEANVLGYYSFSSANNLGRDDAGGTAPITFSGTVGQVTGPSGSGALDLSGGAHGNIASMTTGGAMTIATWVRFDTTSANGFERVIDLGQANSGGIGNIYIARLGTTNNLTFTIEKNGIYTHRATANNAIVNGSWMHVAGTVDASGNMTLYVNGVALATATGVAPDVGVRTNHYIGRSGFAVDGAFDGAIDDLLITNGAMSAANVSALYQQTVGFSVAENSANTTLIGTLLATDPDAGNTYTFSLTNNAGGRFAIDSTTGQITVANGSLLDFETATSHTITARVTDQNNLTYDEVVTISISNVNEAPVMTPTSPTLPLTENGGAFAANISSLLGSSVTDQDAGAVEGIAITNLSLGGGTLEYSLNGTTWTAVSGVSTTNALLLRATDQMRFTPSSTNGGTTLISFNAWDQTSGTAGGFANATITGGSTAFSVASDTITVNVTSVNDAPVLDNSGVMILSTITEDQTTNSGQTVASIIASAGGDRITDVDTGAVEGIAITTLSSGNGTWQYSLDGTNWTNVGTVSDSSSLLLRSTDFIRFVPNAENATTASFDFRAWDQTSGSAGSKVATTTNGNATAFSTATESASITVTAVNDSIGSLSDANATANTVAENAAIGTTVGITALATDVDSGDTVTYSLDFNANGRYAIHSSTGVVTVAGALNAESQFAETILVRATSSDGSSVTRGYSITVTSVNEAPNDIRIPVSVVSENFESGATGWSNNQTVAGGGTLTNYLGGWGNENGATQVFKDFSLSGAQSSVTITFDMYEMDSWDGEAFKVWVDNVEYSSHTLWMDWYANFYIGREDEIAITQQITDGLSSLGGVGTFDDEIHRYSFTINTTSTNIRLGFSSTLDSPASNESWGVDNLTIVENRPVLSVAENSANTTVVGTVQGYDVDAGTTLSYSLTDTAGGRFAINASTGVITVANGSLLNFETATSHNVTVQISDGSLTYSEAVTINLTNANEGPAAVLDTATAIEAGGTANGTAGTNPTGNVLTNDTDVDAGDTKTVAGVAAGVVGSASTNVGLAVNGSYGSITIVANGTYTYTVNNSNATVQALAVGQSINDVFTYTMQDAGGLTSTTQITVTIQGVNDAPVQASIEGTALSYNENAGAVAISSTIAITDVDDANIESAVVAITGNYVNGQDVLGFTNQNGIAGSWNATTGELTLTGSATVAQYQAALRSITYTNSSETPSTLTRTMSFTVNDGSANSNTQTRDINVASVNDAPVLDNTRTPVLQSVSEHAGPPVGAVGTLVTSLIDFATPSGQVDNVTDVDSGPTTGIAITATNAVNGTWWYSTDNGTNWQRIGNVSDASARLLAADSNTRIYFEPTQSTEFSGTISNAITFRAWDQTSGINGGTGNATVNGGTSAFSSATDTAAITINNVNDAPRILGDELIANGDFTTNLSGWTTSGSVAAASGRANFGLSNLVGPHSISQTISTVAGQTYQLSFDYLDGSSTLNQSLVASVTGTGNLLTTAQLVTDVATTAPGARYTFTFVADSSTATITLTDTSDQSGLSNGTANVDGMVDNVSVRQLAGQMGTLNYTENAGPVAIHSLLNLSDFDSTNLVGATVQITSGFNSSQDLLAFTNQLGITGNYNSTTGILTLSGSASVADYQTALRSITYANTSESPSSSRAISFTVDDGSLSSTVATRSIAINTVNDTPIAVADTATAVEAGGTSNGTAGTNPTGNVLTNDTDVDAGDTKTVTGVLAGVQASASANVGSAVTGTFGSISIAADGSYTYTVDNSNASVQELRTTANTLQDVFTYTMRDAAGLTSTTQITVTIQGANDTPVSVVDTAIAVEAGGVGNATAGSNPTGNVLTNDTDVDSVGNGETKAVTGVAAGTQASASGNVATAVSGTYGSLSIAASGAYTYTVNNANAAVQALRNSGQTLTDVFTYTMTDAAGATSSTQITLTIQGANDAPVQSAIEGSPLSYTEGAGAVAISSTLTLDDVDDANLSSATIQITSNYRNGEDLLSFTNQNGISGTWDTLTGTLTLTGSATKAQYQAALRSITYSNFSELPNTSTRTVSFAVSDGELFSAGSSRDIAISSINDAPINQVPGTLVTGVNTPLTLSGANAIQISDVDAASSNVRVTLTAASGTLTLSSTSGLTFTTGDGTNDSNIVFTGTIASINAALDGMQFTPTNGFSGSAAVTLLTEDLGNTGTGGNLSDTDVITIQVGGYRFQEGVSGYTGTQDTYVSSAATSTAYGNANSVLVDDPSQHGLIRFDNIFGSGGGQIAYGSTITSASLSIYVTGTDNLDIVNVHRMLSAWTEASTWSSLTNGVQANNVEAATTISYSIDAGVGGWITITGLTATVQAWSDGAANQGWALLSNGADNWTFHSSEFATVSLRPYLTVAFSAPQSADIDLDANNSSGATGSGFTRTWTENGGALTIADSDASVSDIDSSNLQSMTISISNRQDGTAEVLAANTTGTSIAATYNSSTGILTLSGSDTVANYQQVLRTVTYNNTSESPSTVARLITVQAADAYVSSNIATATINVVSVNDAPVLDSTGNMSLTTITEDEVNNSGNSISSIIASAGGDRITDVDAGAVEGIAVTGLTSGNGSWQYSTNNGTNWSNVGAVDNTSALLLRSSDLIRFVPNGANSTTGQITFRAWDQTTGTAGTKVDTATNGGTTAFSTNTEIASITVTAVNDTPTAVLDTATAVEAGGVNNGSAGSNPSGNVLTNDTDVDTGDTKTVTGVAAGAIGSAVGSVATSVAGTYGTINIASDGSYVYTVDNANATVQALANSGQSIQEVFTYTVTDSAGATSSTQITVTIQGANDTPTITSNGGGSTASISLAENVAAVTTVVGSDVDAGTSFTYSIIGGVDAAKFTITAGGSLAFVSAPDFETPTDVGGNNIYDVIVQVSDGSLATTQAIAVTITDVSNFLVVTTATDNNDSGIATGASYDIEWLNANKGADGSVSLREAIVAANNTAGTDTVNFGITGTGVKTINLASALPAITDTIVINGYSQTGSSVNTLATGNNAVLNIVLNGAGAGAGANGLTLAAGSSGSSLRGLVIDNFSQYGISVSSANNTLAGNFIGLNQAGNAAAGNSYGIYINNVGGNTIGGLTAADRNVISGNAIDGIYINGASATNNSIQGNYIGTNAAGTAAVANGAMGVRIAGSAAGNTIGGSSAGAGNLISGNANSGVYIDASNTTVKGNLIGTNASGTGAIRNGSLGSATGGIFIASGTGSVIGGTTAADRNVLSGNGGAGIWIEGTTGSHTIQGNYVGVDVTGDTALANGRWGIVLNVGP